MRSGARYSKILLVLTGILVPAVIARAHHSIAAEFDFQKPVHVTGVSSARTGCSLIRWSIWR
jgi:hypothetical protein